MNTKKLYECLFGITWLHILPILKKIAVIFTECTRTLAVKLRLHKTFGLQQVDDRISRQSAHDGVKVVMPYAPAAFTPHPPENILGDHFCWVNLLQDHRADGGIKSMKNPNNTRNRTRDLPACSAVPQPTTSPRTPAHLGSTIRNQQKNENTILNQDCNGVGSQFRVSSESRELAFRDS
jgi:hypothetical protein